MRIKNIINLTKRMVSFWSAAEGWAPLNAAHLMSKSRLDRQLSLTMSLEHWVQKDSLTDGELILAWANLGALVEGYLKLFLAVYLEDYKTDIDRWKNHKGEIIFPDTLALEKLRQFFIKKSILNQWHSFINHVQKRRNAIHAFKDRDIGNFEEFHKSVDDYLDFIIDLNDLLPYPDECYP